MELEVGNPSEIRSTCHLFMKSALEFNYLLTDQPTSSEGSD